MGTNALITVDKDYEKWVDDQPIERGDKEEDAYWEGIFRQTEFLKKELTSK